MNQSYLKLGLISILAFGLSCTSPKDKREQKIQDGEIAVAKVSQALQKMIDSGVKVTKAQVDEAIEVSCDLDPNNIDKLSEATQNFYELGTKFIKDYDHGDWKIVNKKELKSTIAASFELLKQINEFKKTKQLKEQKIGPKKQILIQLLDQEEVFLQENGISFENETLEDGRVFPHLNSGSIEVVDRLKELDVIDSPEEIVKSLDQISAIKNELEEIKTILQQSHQKLVKEEQIVSEELFANLAFYESKLVKETVTSITKVRLLENEVTNLSKILDLIEQMVEEQSEQTEPLI